MEKPTNGFAFYLDPKNPVDEYEYIGKNISTPYNGKMTPFRFNENT